MNVVFALLSCFSLCKFSGYLVGIPFFCSLLDSVNAKGVVYPLYTREMMVVGLMQQVLRTDVAGMPLEWINYRDAVRLYYLGQVAYSCGSLLYRVRGGINTRSGQPSIIEVNSIVATYGRHVHSRTRRIYTPPLNNKALFKRDAHLCLYCGVYFQAGDLSRDHVTPLSQHGADCWSNVVSACKRCNSHKAGRTPEQAQMELLAVPFIPTHAEYVYLQSKRVLADQMEFLLAHFPRSSPLHERIHRQRD